MKRQLGKPGAGRGNQPIAIASRFIEEGKDREAEQLLLKWRPKDSKLEAERLALLGFVRWRLGDTKAYRSLAVEAANKARTSLTLYHLGLALPPEEGLSALRGAFEAYSGDHEGEGRVAYALARVLRRLGRFPEAYRWASLAALRGTSPYYQLEEIALDLFVGETPLEDLAQEVLPYVNHKALGPRLYASWLQVQLASAAGKPVETHVASWATLVPGDKLAFDLPAIILALKKENPELGWRLLRAAQAAAKPDVLTAALLDLAEGFLRFPQPEGIVALERALPILRENMMEEAFRAQAHLASFSGQPLLGPFRLIADSLRREARVLFAPEGVFWQRPYLQALGNGRLVGFPRVRKRSLETLVLLLSHPEGLSGQKLAKALYGRPNVEAAKVEVSRLRGIGFEIASRPYRLLNPPDADFLELRRLLAEGRLREAIALYKGPLLPRSYAPGVETLRRVLENELREAVLASRDPDAIYALAQKLEDDLEAWKDALNILARDDPRRPVALAWVCRLREQYK